MLLPCFSKHIVLKKDGFRLNRFENNNKKTTQYAGLRYWLIFSKRLQQHLRSPSIIGMKRVFSAQFADNAWDS